jgi:hypothetical protein
MVTADGTQSSAEQMPLFKTQAGAVVAYWSQIQQHAKTPRVRGSSNLLKCRHELRRTIVTACGSTKCSTSDAFMQPTILLFSY